MSRLERFAMALLWVGISLGTMNLIAKVPSQDAVPLITPNPKWAVCMDFTGRDLPLVVGVDGSQPQPVPGIAWEPNGSLFKATIPLELLPAVALKVGVHTVLVRDTGSVVTLADGSTVTIPGGELSVSYRVLDVTGGAAPTNPRLIRIGGG